MEKRKNPWMVAFLVLAFLVLAGIVGGVSYLLGKNKETSTEAKPTATPTLQVTPSPTPTIDETDAISAAVYKKLKSDSSKLTVTVSKQIGNYAKGGIKEVDAVGGAYFIAAKVAEEWIIVYDGQANPTCTQIAPYNFPVDLVPECINSSSKVVPR